MLRLERGVSWAPAGAALIPHPTPKLTDQTWVLAQRKALLSQEETPTNRAPLLADNPVRTLLSPYLELHCGRETVELNRVHFLTSRKPKMTNHMSKRMQIFESDFWRPKATAPGSPDKAFPPSASYPLELLQGVLEWEETQRPDSSLSRLPWKHLDLGARIPAERPDICLDPYSPGASDVHLKLETDPAEILLGTFGEEARTSSIRKLVLNGNIGGEGDHKGNGL
ncbi:hypothetical protein E5288_WYG003292 [Bos mutus]|uniref:Uncharacterized protein n=1 Tax=Bos mutus TaxID=72004 RepID=A0A6B0SBE0_9CETA|nr:hypothetical protein [Bos mutus]